MRGPFTAESYPILHNTMTYVVKPHLSTQHIHTVISLNAVTFDIGCTNVFLFSGFNVTLM